MDHLKTIDTRLMIDVTQVPPKISKGENYKGLPYLMLDYPRLFDKETIFAIRTMFWWGNFFSITLHLAGSYKNQFEDKCISALAILKTHDFFTCIHPEERDHHFDPSNYTAIKYLDQLQWEKIIKEKSFIKIAKRYSLHQWDDADNKLPDDFTLITGVLAF